MGNKNLGTAFDADIGTVYCDDGQGSRLEVYSGGNGDWYLTIMEKGHDDLFRRCSIRVCTSGSAQPQWFTSLVAGMHAVLRGEHVNAAELFKGAGECVVTQKLRDAHGHDDRRKK